MPSKIEWCEESWNPIAGCTKCSLGCLNCYAERMARRLAGIGAKGYNDGVLTAKGQWTGNVKCLESALDKPLHWKKPRRIFVCSMSDLFHPKVPEGFIIDVFDVIAQAAAMGHTLLVLTKRVKRMKEILGEYCGWLNPTDLEEFSPYKNNIHLGVSISNPDELWKVDELKKIPAAVRFLSIEPLLAGIEFTYDRLFCDRDPEEDSPVACVPCRCGKHWENSPIRGTTLNCIDWVVVGGESGPKRRPCKIEWVQSIVEQCKTANVPVFVKQIHQDGKVVKMPAGWPQDYPK